MLLSWTLLHEWPVCFNLLGIASKASVHMGSRFFPLLVLSFSVTSICPAMPEIPPPPGTLNICPCWAPSVLHMGSFVR